MKAFLIHLFLGNSTLPKDSYEYKAAWLRVAVSLLSILICALYLIIDIYNYTIGGRDFYLLLIFGSGLALALNRHGRYHAATTAFLVFASLTLYVMISNDVLRTGVYLYLITFMLASFALFGPRQLSASLVFSGFLLVLFFLAYVYHLRPVTLRMNMDERAAELSLYNNFVIAFMTCGAFFYFMMRLNSRAEDALREKNQALEKANRELDRFVYSTSHDMRAPLSSILGLVDIAKQTHNPAELAQYLEMMKGRVLHLQGFLRDITNYARNERQELKTEPVPVATMVTDIIHELRYLKPMARIRVDIQIEAALKVSTDATRLRIILTNLIGNAIRYSDLSKADPFIGIQAVTLPGETHIAIEDNGIGIAPDQKGKVFDMFYRGSEQSEGSGLGLYIASEAAAKLGATIECLSEPAKGSRFTVRLPASR